MTRLLALPTVSDYLGAPEGRFFGAGYRRANYRFAPLTVTADGVGTTVSIDYPSDWSRKKVGHDLRPHLSTVDVMVFAARLGEAVLAAHLGLTAEQRSRSWIKRVVIQAGAKPEEHLEQLPVTAALRREEYELLGWKTASVDCRAGQMRVRLTIAHPKPTPAIDAPGAGDIDAILGDGEMRYWGDGFRNESQRVETVVADLDKLTCTARVVVEPTPRDGWLGLEDAEGFPVSLVDAFVSHVQLAQVLLYELDDVARSDSNTLWMQQTSIERDYAAERTAGPASMEVGVTKTNLLQVNGGQWRDLTFTGRVGGLIQRSTFAHRLPDKIGSPGVLFPAPRHPQPLRKVQS